MALTPTRMEFRIQLSHVDRGIERAETVVAARHPSETMEHLVLRVLAWCLLSAPELTFGPGLSDGDAADLWAHDATGRLVTWVECGATKGDKVRRLVNQNAGAAVHVVVGDPRRREELLAELAGWKRAGELAVWTIDGALVRGLAEDESRRQK